MWKEGLGPRPCQGIEKIMEHEIAFVTVTKGLLKGLEDLEVGRRVKTIQTRTLMRTARILRRVLETWGDLLSLKVQLKTINSNWCEKLLKSK